MLVNNGVSTKVSTFVIIRQRRIRSRRQPVVRIKGVFLILEGSKSFVGVAYGSNSDFALCNARKFMIVHCKRQLSATIGLSFEEICIRLEEKPEYNG